MVILLSLPPLDQNYNFLEMETMRKFKARGKKKVNLAFVVSSNPFL